MRISTLTALLVFCSLTGSAQDRFSILFNLTQSGNNYTYNYLFPDQPALESPIVLPVNDQYGFSARKNTEGGRFYELLLATTYYQRTIEYNRPLSPLEDNRLFTSSNVDLHLRLEIGQSITLPSLPNLYFGISASLDPRLTIRNYESHISSLFPFRTRNLETSVLLSPQIEYAINERIIFLLKMPLQVLSFSHIFTTNKNPSLPKEEQSFNKEIIDFLTLSPTYTIGVGYYLHHKDR